MTVPERVVIEAEQNASVPHADGCAEARMEMAWRAKIPEAPVEMMAMEVRLEVVMVAMAAMEEPVMAVAAVSTAQKPVVTMTTVPAPGQKNHSVRVNTSGITESNRCRTNPFFIGPGCGRCREEQARQQHGQHRNEEPH
jgi:hypothetical protein